jgi:imidazole glycerol-phosphate synthase subunit HisH
MIHVVHYGIGNVGSIRNMLHRLGVEAVLASDADGLREARKIILSGVGSFDRAMEELERRGLVDALNEKVQGDSVPILGVCLGMQLFTKGSEEGARPGLGWLDARTVLLPRGNGDSALRLPHMGWNSISLKRETPLLEGLPEDKRFYFVHSYHVTCADTEPVAACAEYGIEFTCAVAKDRIYGTQFHPEKSHRFGMRVLENFALRC